MAKEKHQHFTHRALAQTFAHKHLAGKSEAATQGRQADGI
jgi:hypothetical protein